MTSTDQPGTEVARPKPPVTLSGPQGDLDSTFRLANALAQSNLLPKDLRGKPSDVLVSILYGQELGIAPMQAMQSIYVVQGRPTISAQLWVALARRAGHKVRVVEETAESCTVEVERADDPGHPTRVTYTLDQAKAAKLTGKDVWTGHRAAMLYARAVSTACRRACPEIALGFGDETERVEPEPKPTLGQVAAERTDKPAEPSVIETQPVEADHPTQKVPAPDPAELQAAYAELDAEATGLFDQDGE